MLARIASIAAAALLVAATATPAHAGGDWYTKLPNGGEWWAKLPNGGEWWVKLPNGGDWWVKLPNGAATNTTGFVVKGIELPAHLR